MPHSDLMGAPRNIMLTADEPLTDYVPELKEGEVVTGTKLRKLSGHDAFGSVGSTIEINGRQVWLSPKEAAKIYVGWETPLKGEVEPSPPSAGDLPHKRRPFSVGGLVVSGLLFLILLGNVGTQFSEEGPVMFSLMLAFAVPAAALLIRSFRPPVGFLRGLAVVFGGMLLGMSTKLIEFSLLIPNYGGQAADIIFAVTGLVLLWVGFKPVKRRNGQGRETEMASHPTGQTLCP